MYWVVSAARCSPDILDLDCTNRAADTGVRLWSSGRSPAYNQSSWSIVSYTIAKFSLT